MPTLVLCYTKLTYQPSTCASCITHIYWLRQQLCSNNTLWIHSKGLLWPIYAHHCSDCQNFWVISCPNSVLYQKRWKLLSFVLLNCFKHYWTEANITGFGPADRRVLAITVQSRKDGRSHSKYFLEIRTISVLIQVGVCWFINALSALKIGEINLTKKNPLIFKRTNLLSFLETRNWFILSDYIKTIIVWFQLT